MVQELSPAGKIVWKVAMVVQIVMGFTIGLYLFTQGPLLYESFSHVVDAKLAMTLTTLLFGLGMGLAVLLEVPTGAIGDAIGRKKTVVWSLLFRALFFIALAFVWLLSSSFTWLLFFSISSFVLFACSYTLYSGSFTAWCVDSLKSSDPEVGYEHLSSSTYMYNFTGVILGGILGVVFYVNSLAHVGFLIAAGVCVACIVFCLGEMEDDGVSGKTADLLGGLKLESITQRIGEIIGVGFQVFRKSTMILSLVVMFSSFLLVRNIIDYLWPIYLRSRILEDVQGYYWALLVVATYFSCLVGAKAFKFWAERNSRKTGHKKLSNAALRNWLVAACLLSSVPIIGLSWLTAKGLDTFWAFSVAILPLYLAYGVILPCFETLVNNYIPNDHSKERATILSFASLLRCLLVLLLIVPSGGTSGESTTVGWAIPATLLLTATIVGGYLLKREQTKHEIQVVAQGGTAASSVSETV